MHDLYRVMIINLLLPERFMLDRYGPRTWLQPQINLNINVIIVKYQCKVKSNRDTVSDCLTFK